MGRFLVYANRLLEDTIIIQEQENKNRLLKLRKCIPTYVAVRLESGLLLVNKTFHKGTLGPTSGDVH